MKLRHYQEKAIEEIRRHYAKGTKRVLLHLATGGGKTLTFCTIIKMSAARGKRCLVVVRGVKLIEQASERLTREGVEHGIIRGSDSRGEYLPVLVCSIDTLYRRKHAPEADLIIIDEAHQTGGEGYAWFLSQYPKAYLLPVSATPHLKKGMKHVADVVVYPISIQQLIDEWHLVKSRTFVGVNPDLSDVAIASTGDFKEDQLSDKMQEVTLLGEPSKRYKEIAGGEKAICFAVTVEHSMKLVEQFAMLGYKAKHVDANTPIDKRNQIIEELRTGQIDVICNVGILHTGFDLPELRCLILARPTMSYNLHIQMLGRGTRPYPGKEYFTVIDCAGNTKRHGFIEDEEICNLEGAKLRQASTVDCQDCSFIYPLRKPNCPNCGAENMLYVPAEKREASERKFDTLDTRMIELKRSENSKEKMQIDRWVAKAKEKGYKKGWIFNKLKEKYGEAKAQELWNKEVKNLRTWPVRERLDQITPNSSQPSCTSSTSQVSASSGQTTPEPSRLVQGDLSATDWWARQISLDSTAKGAS